MHDDGATDVLLIADADPCTSHALWRVVAATSLLLISARASSFGGVLIYVF